jgi:hypothetical protein
MFPRVVSLHQRDLPIFDEDNTGTDSHIGL